MTDIEKYIDDPAEVDEQVNKSCGAPNHATEADFDKIRDGLDNEETVGDEAAVDANNGVVAHVVGSPDEGEGLDGEVNADSSASPATTPATTTKAGGKRTPKAKSVTAASVKSTKGSATKSTHKRRTSAQQTPSGTSNAKRGRRAASGEAAQDVEGASATPTARRRVETDALLASLAAKRAPNAIALLDRPVVTRPEAQVIDMSSRSNTLADREIVPSEQTFGFLGLGMMGSTIVKDLIYTGHKVVVWNRTIDKVSVYFSGFKVHLMTFAFYSVSPSRRPVPRSKTLPWMWWRLPTLSFAVCRTPRAPRM